MNIKKIIDNWRTRINRLIDVTRRHTIPGFGNLSIYEVGSAFMRSLKEGTLGMRSAAIAFNFFIAMFPMILFLFTLIPYIPIRNFQSELISLLEQMIPAYTFETLEETLVDIAMNPRSGLLSVGFVSTLILVSNGVTAVIKAFNTSVNAPETRSALKLRLASLIMIFGITILLAAAIATLIFGRSLLYFLIKKHIIFGVFSKVVFYVAQGIIVLGLCIASVSLVYYCAPAKRTHMHFISTGSVLATVLLIATSAGFGYYLSNFSQYNALYGSIGTLIGMMVWLNLNASILLIGFELNLSIKAAHVQRDADKLVLANQ